MVIKAGGQEAEDELALLEGGEVIYVGFFCKLQEAFTGKGLQVCDINARGFAEYGRAHCGGWSPFHGVLEWKGVKAGVIWGLDSDKAAPVIYKTFQTDIG